jgi:hypothetical protein
MRGVPSPISLAGSHLDNEIEFEVRVNDGAITTMRSSALTTSGSSVATR